MKKDSHKKIKIKKFLVLSRNVKIKKDKNSVIINNKSGVKQKVFLNKIFKSKTDFISVKFVGKVVVGEASVMMKFFTVDKKFSEPIILNSYSVAPNLFRGRRLFSYITIPPQTCIKITELSIAESENGSILDINNFKNDVLIITPMYPTNISPYSATFVYSKNQEYKKNNINTDVVVVNNNEKNNYEYKYRDDNIYKMSYDDLRILLHKKKYSKILVHFLDDKIGNTLSSCDLDGTDLMIYCHGADVDLYNYNIFGKYFKKDVKFSNYALKDKEKRMETLQRFNEMDNVTWVFNTEWNLKNAKKVTGLDFSRNIIAACVIDSEKFEYRKRSEDKRKKILIVKKMDNTRQYAVDIAVRIIIKLAKKDYFNDLEITVVGDGDFQKELTAPLAKYANVKVNKGFIHNDVMSKMFEENGILLAPSRYDTQGVTVGEAAMSGMVVVASNKTGVSEMISEKSETFFDNDNIDEAVEIIDYLYNNPEIYCKKSEEIHNSLVKSLETHNIKKEIDLIKNKPTTSNERLKVKVKNSEPILSVIIPTYNAEIYIENAVKSIINQTNNHLVEVLIIDDGSTDNTKTVVEAILKKGGDDIRKIVRYFRKENGGHGSTINFGLKVAKGKYVRVLDADDRFDSEALRKHLDRLSKTDADIVFTDTVHDFSQTGETKIDCKYEFMTPHVMYDFDELCVEGYGFPGYGPVLSTVSIKVDKLKEVGCELLEKCFYVDIEYNYFMTEAAKTAEYDPVNLYYYYLGRVGQSLSNESYKKNFYQHLKVMEAVIKLLEEHKLSAEKYGHFVRIQMHETISHQYRIALDMFMSYKKYREVEKVLKKYPTFYNDKSLVPNSVIRIRKYGWTYFILRKTYGKVRRKISNTLCIIRRKKNAE